MMVSGRCQEMGPDVGAVTTYTTCGIAIKLGCLGKNVGSTAHKSRVMP